MNKEDAKALLGLLELLNLKLAVENTKAGDPNQFEPEMHLPVAIYKELEKVVAADSSCYRLEEGRIVLEHQSFYLVIRPKK